MESRKNILNSFDTQRDNTFMQENVLKIKIYEIHYVLEISACILVMV